MLSIGNSFNTIYILTKSSSFNMVIHYVLFFHTIGKEVNNMSYLKINVGIFLLLVFFACNALIMLTAGSGESEWMVQMNQWHGMNILLSMTFVFLINTRSQKIYRIFGGNNLTKSMQRLLIILSLIFVYLHVLFSYVARVAIFIEGSFNLSSLVGLILYLIFGLLMLFLLIRTSSLINQPYLHALMMVVFGVGTYHAITSSQSLLSFSLLGLWVLGIVVIGSVVMMVPPIQFVVNRCRSGKYRPIKNNDSSTSQV